MSTRQGQYILGVFMQSTGRHIASWRHQGAQADGGVNFSHYRRVTQTAERAKFDMVFLSDGVAVRRNSNLESLSLDAKIVHFEPLTLLSALAAVTEHIGLVATASTTYNEPYHIARTFASLDYLSDGRAGWNVVTSATEAEAKNFNCEHHMEHALRYERAREFVQVVTGLWDSWDDDAFIRNKATGVAFEPERLHVLNHKGKHFSVRGPLNISRPPQGYPVIIEAGASDNGRDFAAETAEVVFTAQQTLEEAQAFYKNLKARLTFYGRSPHQLKIMPGVFPVVGRTEAEAKEKYEQLQSLILPALGLSLLSGLIGDADLSSYPLDGPLPELPETNGHRSRQKLVTELVAREKLTIRQAYQAIAGGRGHWTICGTPEQIADCLESWYVNDAADGFNIMPPYLPGGLDDFVEYVIPLLQRRGRFRTEYEGHTLRENLGLLRPGNQFSGKQ